MDNDDDSLESPFTGTGVFSGKATKKTPAKEKKPTPAKQTNLITSYFSPTNMTALPRIPKKDDPPTTTPITTSQPITNVTTTSTSSTGRIITPVRPSISPPSTPTQAPPTTKQSKIPASLVHTTPTPQSKSPTSSQQSSQSQSPTSSPLLGRSRSQSHQIQQLHETTGGEDEWKSKPRPIKTRGGVLKDSDLIKQPAKKLPPFERDSAKTTTTKSTAVKRKTMSSQDDEDEDCSSYDEDEDNADMDDDYNTSIKKQPGKRQAATAKRSPPFARQSMSAITTTTSKKKPAVGSRKKAAANTSDDDFIPTTTSRGKKQYNISLDDLLKEKMEKGSFQENVDTDKLIFDKDDPINKKPKTRLDPETKIDVKSALGEDNAFNKKEINQLETLFVAPDLFLQETYRKCIDTEVIIPEVMQQPKFSQQDLIKYPILKLIESSKQISSALLNTLSCMIEISPVDSIPDSLIRYVFSNICYEKNDLIVSQSYELLNIIGIKIFGEKNGISKFFPFNDFISVFKSYKIKMDFQSLKDFKDTSNSFSSPSSKVNYNFPTVNLFRVLGLLKLSVEKQSFNVYQVKELIKFVIILSLDPKFLPKIPMNQSVSSHTNTTTKKYKSMVQTLSKDQISTNAKSFQSITLLKSILLHLLNTYFDKNFHIQEHIKINGAGMCGDDEETRTGGKKFDFNLAHLMDELFDEIVESIGQESKFTLYTKIAQSLPTNTLCRVHERFSLYSIFQILNDPSENKTTPVKKYKSSKSLKKSKSKNDNNDDKTTTKSTKKSKTTKNEVKDEMKIDKPNNEPIPTTVDTVTTTTTDDNLANVTDEKEVMKTDEPISTVDNNTSTTSTDDPANVTTSSQEIVSITAAAADQLTTDQVNTTTILAAPLTPLPEPITTITILSSKDIIESLVLLVRPYVSKIKHYDFNVENMVNMVQLVSIVIDDISEIKRHSSEIETIIRAWNTKVREPENIDFNKSRIKDTLVGIQSKISGLVIKQSETIENYFDLKR